MVNNDDFQRLENKVDKIDEKLETYNQTLITHTSRQDVMESFVKESQTNMQKNFELMLQSNEKHQKNMIKVIVVSIGIFSAIAGLVTALLSH